MPETVAEMIAQLERSQQEALEWQLRSRREELEHEQRMRSATMVLEQRADAMRNVMLMAMNPNINAEDFDRLVDRML